MIPPVHSAGRPNLPAVDSAKAPMQNDALSQPVPFSILRGHKLGWHFDPDPEGGGGGGGNNPPMIAKSEADAAFAARDKAKKRAESAVALLAELLGVDADQVDVTESGVSVPELDVLKEKIVAARKSGKTPDQQLAEAEAKFTKKLSDAQKAH